MEEPIKLEEPKKEETLCPEELIPSSGERIFIDHQESHAKKNRSDDVMLTQCIFCVVLVLSIFGLHWVSRDFQEELLSLYQEKVSAPAEPFLVKMIETVEQWLHR